MRCAAWLAVLGGASAVDVGALDDGVRRRPARTQGRGALNEGEGARTPVFGGGKKTYAQKGVPTFTLLSDAMRDNEGRFVLGREFQGASDGQARWLAGAVFGHTSRALKPGVFVEFGARDGGYESNTLLYEKFFAWSGVLIESGRDYMHALRNGRNCKCAGLDGACVWAALTDVQGGFEVWNVANTTRNRPLLEEYEKYHQMKKYAPPVSDRAVETRTLQSVLDKFELTHFDYLVADCDGCEAQALLSLNLVRTKVDVITVEYVDCATAQRLLHAGYVLLPLKFSGDQIFLHARVAKLIPAPQLYLDTPDEAKDGFEHVRKLAQDCKGVEEGTWWQGEWPPKRLESYQDF